MTFVQRLEIVEGVSPVDIWGEWRGRVIQAEVTANTKALRYVSRKQVWLEWIKGGISERWSQRGDSLDYVDPYRPVKGLWLLLWMTWGTIGRFLTEQWHDLTFILKEILLAVLLKIDHKRTKQGDLLGSFQSNPGKIKVTQIREITVEVNGNRICWQIGWRV